MRQEPLGLNPVPPVLEPEAWGKTWVNPWQALWGTSST